jgi:two-component system, NtrC family, sensor histidine kinase HydH
MTALLYFLVAVMAAGLSTRAWMLDRTEPSRAAFLALGWTVTLCYVGFSLSLLPGLDDLRLLYMFAGCAIPATALWTLDRLFARDDVFMSVEVTRAFGVTALVAPTLTGAQILLYDDVIALSPPQVLAGVFAGFGFVLLCERLFRVVQNSSLRVDRARLTYLFTVTASAVVFTVLEQAARALTATPDPSTMSLANRGVVLQGAVPPFSALFVGLTLYFLYSSLIMYRLLDLHELFSRLATLLTSAAILLVVDGLTFMWVDTFTTYPFHSTFQIFLASVMFLAAYEPLRDNISWVANRVFNQRGQQLADMLDNLRAQLATVISTQGFVETLLSGLHSSGRIPVCSVYLWQQGAEAFVCLGSVGHERRPLKTIAANPFTDGFERGMPWYSRYSVVRRSRNDPSWAEVLGLMDAMNADLTVPFISGGAIIGWYHVRDEDWSDGFSAEEIQRLQSIAALAAVVLSNIQDFKVLEEKNRLAALGAMAAGLAHEIRNPLAGVKGAAQYLQHEVVDDESQEMLSVIIGEADRLNNVVTQFLDYARPFELDLRPEHINALVSRSLMLLRAQGIPDGVEVIDDLAGDLPTFALDSTRLTQVVLNLLQNALQAMPDGGRLTVTTRRRVGRSGYVVEVVVSDTGVGIASDDLEKLFVPFFTTKEHGTGLGLAISQRIAQTHDGELEAQSIEGRGSTFVLRLPLPQTLETEEHPG